MEQSSKILSEVIHYMKYARYLPKEYRRETWVESCTRVMNMHVKKYPQLKEEIEDVFKNFVFTNKVLPSLRTMQFGGEAIEKNPVRGFNCSYAPIDSWETFHEIMFLLLAGCGVGYSVQKYHVSKLPEIRRPNRRVRRHLVTDSIEGWADAVKVLMKSYFFGTSMIEFDYSDIRPKGTLLKTSGGRAPGPQPLKDCVHNLQKILDTTESGDQLTSLEVHDMICYIADAVLSGGIRRSSLIALFDIDDEAMLTSKFGKWWEINPQRARANNSVMVLRHKITKDKFDELWEKIKSSGSGEPGIYFSNNATEYGVNPCQPTWATVLTPEGIKTLGDVSTGDTIWSGKRWTKITEKWSTGVKPVFTYLTNAGVFVGTDSHKIVSNGVKIQVKDALSIDTAIGTNDYTSKIIDVTSNGQHEVFDITVEDEDHTYWTGGLLVSNCNEASLRAYEFCNLTTQNVSELSSQKELNDLSRAAAFVGTLQAGYTDFHYLREIWRENTEKDALLGVSMTGVASGAVFKYNLTEAANVVLKENARIAKIIGVNKAARTTLMKPEGTGSLRLGTSSGIHDWHSPYFIRRITVMKNEPIYVYLKEAIPELIEDDFFKPQTQAKIKVPVKAPDGATFRTAPALDLLERVKKVYDEWVKPGHRKGDNTHNISCTVSVNPNAWTDVGNWMWENRDHYNGLSVIPEDLGTYVQAPFTECTKEEYEALLPYLKDVDLSMVVEHDDNTDHKDQPACSGTSCVIT